MSTAQDILDLLARIDTATNAVATRIQDLVNQLNNATGGLSATEAANVASRLSSEVTILEGMGKEPTV